MGTNDGSEKTAPELLLEVRMKCPNKLQLMVVTLVMIILLRKHMEKQVDVLFNIIVGLKFCDRVNRNRLYLLFYLYCISQGLEHDVDYQGMGLVHDNNYITGWELKQVVGKNYSHSYEREFCKVLEKLLRGVGIFCRNFNIM